MAGDCTGAPDAIITHGVVPPAAALRVASAALRVAAAALVRAETENAAFVPACIWRDSVRRFSVRLMAYEEGITRWVTAREAWRELSIPPQVTERHDRTLEPIAFLTETGSVEYHVRYTDLLDTLK